VTATRDRRSDPEIDAGPAWDDRPILGQFRGLSWWAAVLLAFGVTAIAAFVDMQRQDSLGRIYQGAFVVGCVVAVCVVRRRSLFGPIVQPPLVFAITAIGAIVALGPKTGSGGLKSLVISVALPLTSNFPTLGITTAVVVAIGVFRLWRERDPNPVVRPSKPVKERAARGGDGGLAEEPGQGTGGRDPRERPSKDRVAAPPRRGRPEPEDGSADERGGRRTPGRGPRPSPSREPGGRDGVRDAGREAGREPRRRDAPGRGERGRVEPPDGGRGRVEPPDGARGRGRGGEPPVRRREPGGEGGSRDERGAGRRDPGRDGARDGRGGTPPGRQPRRRPPEDDYR
jgi:uncharacterized protein DUF6542